MLSIVCTFILLLTCVPRTISYTRNVNWAEEIPECDQDGNIDINNLGLQILNNAIVYPGNVFLSPISLVWSLAILYGLSSNQTAQSISKLLDKSGAATLDSAVVEEELADLLQSLRSSESTFHLSNEIIFKSSHKISDQFKSALLKINDSEINHVSTIWESLLDKEEINATGNHAEENSSNYSELPNIEIQNLMIFNDSWKIQFTPNKTERDYFYSGKRETTEVWMMSLEAETFNYFEDLEMRYKFIELPYEKGDRSMVLVLPTQYDQPADLQLNAEAFCSIKSKMIPTKLDMVSIPKFHFEEEHSLKELLISAGLKDIFIETTPTIGDNEAYLSDIKQTINIEVDEDGGETASIAKLKFKPVAFRGVKEFVANHPFIFYIEDKKTGTLLLSGRIDEPSESISFSERLHFLK